MPAPALHRLPPTIRLDRLAETCRKTATRFLDGVRDGWDKHDVAEWLTGPYRRLTLLRYSLAELAWADVLDAKDARAPSRPIPTERVTQILESARGEVLDHLRLFARSEDAAIFVLEARGRGAVVRCADAQGRVGFLPADLPRMRLADRVLSLVATDYLLRTDDYEQLCSVCWRCESVVFDADARRIGACAEHAGMRPSAQSGISVKESAHVSVHEGTSKVETLRGIPIARKLG